MVSLFWGGMVSVAFAGFFFERPRWVFVATGSSCARDLCARVSGSC